MKFTLSVKHMLDDDALSVPAFKHRQEEGTPMHLPLATCHLPRGPLVSTPSSNGLSSHDKLLAYIAPLLQSRLQCSHDSAYLHLPYSIPPALWSALIPNLHPRHESLRSTFDSASQPT